MPSAISNGRILGVTAGGPYAWIIFNALAEVFGPITVLEEKSESKAIFLKRRIQKFGLVETIGQFAMMIASRVGKSISRERIDQIIEDYCLSPSPGHLLTRVEVDSINDRNSKDLIDQLQPNLIFLAGCRILSPPTLSAIFCPIINYHAGICPKYRGMNGGYFALAENDREHFGSTVHLVDAGVDTGSILYQKRFAPTEADNFFTYSMLMAAESREIAISSVRDALNGKLNMTAAELPSRQWFHPTLWRYIATGIRQGIW